MYRCLFILFLWGILIIVVSVLRIKLRHFSLVRFSEIGHMVSRFVWVIIFVIGEHIDFHSSHPRHLLVFPFWLFSGFRKWEQLGIFDIIYLFFRVWRRAKYVCSIYFSLIVFCFRHLKCLAYQLPPWCCHYSVTMLIDNLLKQSECVMIIGFYFRLSYI